MYATLTGSSGHVALSVLSQGSIVSVLAGAEAESSERLRTPAASSIPTLPLLLYLRHHGFVCSEIESNFSAVSLLRSDLTFRSMKAGVPSSSPIGLERTHETNFGMGQQVCQ
jgi:hypothetical protein